MVRPVEPRLEGHDRHASCRATLRDRLTRERLAADRQEARIRVSERSGRTARIAQAGGCDKRCADHA